MMIGNDYIGRYNYMIGAITGPKLLWKPSENNKINEIFSGF